MPLIKDTVAASLFPALRAARLLPGVSQYQLIMLKVSDSGDRHLEWLMQRMGAGRWRQLAAAVPMAKPYKDFRRILGFGVLITEYLIAPLKLSDPDREEVIRLGALANFIVTVFDTLLDSENRYVASWELSRFSSWLRGVCFSQTASPGLWQVHWPFAGRDFQLLKRLVVIYFHSLRDLQESSKNSQLYDAVGRHIYRMYQAELETLQPDRQAIGAAVLVRKDSLPFVVMGLPGFLLDAAEQPAGFHSYLKWVYGFGRLIGLVDDVVDYEKDRFRGHINSISVEVTRAESRARSCKEISRRIVSDIQAVQSAWLEWVHPEQVERDLIHYTLTAAVISWFGGMEHIPTQERP